MEFAIAHNDLHSSWRFALRRAPTRGAPTDWLLSRRLALGRAPTEGCPYRLSFSTFGPGKGTHKGCPSTDWLLSAFGPGEGTHKGCPYRLSFSTFGPGKGTHKGCPYQLASLGVWAWEGRPQGAPLPIGFSRRSALGRAPTRGAPTDWLLSAFCPGKGAHKGCPYRWLLSTRAALPIGFSQTFGPGKGTHKGCPYRLASLGVWAWEGHPQGVPLPIAFSRRLGLGRAPTRGEPTRFRQPHEVFLV